MADDENVPGHIAAKRIERSPSFPFIGLTKAVERARAVLSHARRHEVRVTDIAEAWSLGAKSSGTLQTIAALIAYGLLDEQGSGDGRKLRVSDLAFRILEDQRPGAKEAALAEAALNPKLIAEYASIWGSDRPADGVCASELRIDRGFTEDGARGFLKVYDDTITYAQLADGVTGGDDPDLHVRDAETGILSPRENSVVFPRVSPSELHGRQDRFALGEGDVVVIYPDKLSIDSVEDLEDYLKVFLKKVRREAVNRGQELKPD